MNKTIRIGTREIGFGFPCFIVAEAGVNHNCDLALAKRMIDAAAEAGADAVKFQTFRAERLVAEEIAPEMFEVLRTLELSIEFHLQLDTYCRHRGILFLSTPFDEQSADLLDVLPVPAFKIASGELTHFPLLAHIAKKGKPILLSTGMSNLTEVKEAVAALKRAGARDLALLHCTSTYPADPAECHLRVLPELARAFRVPVGYSDHTPGIEVSLAAVALGASVIEKHFTLDRTLPGPDHAMSIEPSELRALVAGIRSVEAALGMARKQATPRELFTAALARRSLVTAKDVPEGAKLTSEFIAIKRPGTGLPPKMLAKVIGRRTRREIPSGTLIRQDMLE